MSFLKSLFKKDSTEVEITSDVQIENVEESVPVDTEYEDDEIQTTFNTDDIEELGGVIVEGDEPELDDSPDVDEEE